MSRLSSDDRRELTELARRAITEAVTDNRFPEVSISSNTLHFSAGAFVTLHCRGKLRGCVGQVESRDPITDTIARIAVDAALYDARFPPVTREEVENLEIEISVLSPVELIAPEAIVVGRHGLIIVKGEKRGLLLPQVALERDWSAERFLEETCAKAGLPRTAWKNPDTQIFGFTAEIFSDSGVFAADSGQPSVTGSQHESSID